MGCGCGLRVSERRVAVESCGGEAKVAVGCGCQLRVATVGCDGEAAAERKVAGRGLLAVECGGEEGYWLWGAAGNEGERL